MKFVGILVGLALLAAAPLAEAAPSSISFAGRLSTSAGPVNGSQLITFKVFNVLTGGTAVWNDTISVNADNGLVFATLGTTANPLDETVFGGTPMYLEITIGSETLTPRLVLNAVPYAVSASTADKLGGVITAANVVQSVTAGTGLTGGGNPNVSGAVTLSVDSTRVQSRVTGTCASGSSIRTIAADGTVTCQNDTNSGGTITGVTAGTGLTGGGASGAVSLAVDTSTIQARVTGTCGPGASIRVIGADGSVACQPDSVGLTTCRVAFAAASAVACNSGEVLTGGGCVSGGTLKSSYPSGNSWQCDGTSPFGAYALCCH